MGYSFRSALIDHLIEGVSRCSDVTTRGRHYADTWDSRPAVEQLWLAATGTVGPAPPLAPGVLAEIGLALFLASLRHPALRTSREVDAVA